MNQTQRRRAALSAPMAPDFVTQTIRKLEPAEQITVAHSMKGICPKCFKAKNYFFHVKNCKG